MILTGQKIIYYTAEQLKIGTFMQLHFIQNNLKYRYKN